MKNKRNRTKDTIFQQNENGYRNMLTRYIYYLLVEYVAVIVVIVTTIEIYLFFLLLPPLLMPSCGRRSLLVCARTRFTYSSSIYQ